MVVEMLPEEQECIALTASNVRALFNYVSSKVWRKKHLIIDTLQSRDWSYTAEDFIQGVMQCILVQVGKKKFPTINHLKKFASKCIDYYYSHEKRKLFYTKQRGSFLTKSIDDPLTDYMTVGDTIQYENSTESDKLDYDTFRQYNLFVVCCNNVFTVCTAKELKNFKSGNALSVNYFLQAQLELKMLDVCRHYKEHGFYMTRDTYRRLIDAILEYSYEHKLLTKEVRTKAYVASRPDMDMALERLRGFANSCVCGYKNSSFELHETTWQCPKCGRLHDRDSLVKFNSGMTNVCSSEKLEFSVIKESPVLKNVSMLRDMSKMTKPF